MRPLSAFRLHRQDHTIADRAALVSAEKLDVGHEPQSDRDNALLRWPGAALIEHMPKPLANEEPHLPCRA